ncbi:MAG TPA: FAD-binding oxidoreductase [Sphingobacteriaceae bacterium]
MEHKVSITEIKALTHDVKRFRCEKPDHYIYVAGQATEVSINKPGFEQEKRPFTFTSLNEDPFLEFTIKSYRDHEGVTQELDHLTAGDELIIDDPWGAISYKGPGYFIAGGAGITPFLAIFRQLAKEDKLAGNKLFFSNKTEEDIILQEELTSMMGGDAVFTITDEPTSRFHQGYINEQFLAGQIEDFSRHFYLCGPPAMVEALQTTLVKLRAAPESVVFEI